MDTCLNTSLEVYDASLSSRPNLKVALVTTIPIKGGGGHRTIFQRLEFLRHFCNATCDIFFLPIPDIFFSETVWRDNLLEWFGFEADGIFYTAHVPREYDCIIATAFDTAEYVALQDIKHKFYFVQDYEPYFFPVGDQYLKALRSYSLGLQPITLGKWLARKLSSENSEVPFSLFGVDDSIYMRKNESREKSICAIYQPEKPRRAPELLVESLKEIAQLDPEIKIYTYGSKNAPIELDEYNNCIHLGVITPDELALLYNRCKAGISISTTNPSRVPFEMMACGLPVIELNLENNRFDIPSEGSILVDPSPAAISNTVLLLLNDEDLQNEKSQGAVNAMLGRTLIAENEAFANALMAHIAQSDTGKSESDGSLSEAERHALISRYEKCAANNDPVLRGSRIKVSLFLSPESIFKKKQLTCAIWYKDDQSDLAWIKGSCKRDRITFKTRLKREQNGLNEILHLHFYDMARDEPVFCFAADMPFQYDSNRKRSIVQEDVKTDYRETVKLVCKML